VFKGTWEKCNLAVAVKKVLRTSVMTREQTIDSFRKEVEILAMLDHPHVLKLYGAVLDDDNICIVTELVPGGSLFDLIHTKPLLKPEAVIAISTGVCKGMTYLHSMGIIHRDLKPGNLLMGAVASPSGPQLVVKVADFGLARVQDAARTMTGGIGTRSKSTTLPPRVE
jgi:serine/threonine protein kinase